MSELEWGAWKASHTEHSGGSTALEDGPHCTVTDSPGTAATLVVLLYSFALMACSYAKLISPTKITSRMSLLEVVTSEIPDVLHATGRLF